MLFFFGYFMGWLGVILHLAHIPEAGWLSVYLYGMVICVGTTIQQAIADGYWSLITS